MTACLKRVIALAVVLAFCEWPVAVDACRWAVRTPIQTSFAQAGQTESPFTLDEEAPLNNPDDRIRKKFTGRKISIDFQNADIHEILKMIGEVSGKNIVAPRSIGGKVTVKLKDVPWDQALDVILSSLNLGVEESGNVLMIYDLPTLRKIQADPKRRR